MALNNTNIYFEHGGNRQVIATSGELKVESGGIINAESGSIPVGVALTKTTTTALAAVITGTTLLPALAGYKYRMTGIKMIATVANAATATSVDIIGTQATSAALLTVNTVGALTDSTLVVTGVTANATQLDDGASWAACDANTAITMIDKGTDITGPTAIITILDYVIEAA